MTDLLRREKLAIYGTTILFWALMHTVLPVAYSESPPPEPPLLQEYQGIDPECRAALETLCVGVEPGSGRLKKCYQDNESKLTPACRQQVQERKSEAASILATPSEETRIERKLVRPSETYLAGFGGYTFGGKFSDIESTGLLPGANLGDRDLADSGVYGAKLGHFFGDRFNWLGVEMEAFNTTPNVEQQGLVPGSHLRVTTLAFNLIGRAQFACETRTDRTEKRTERDAKTNRFINYELRYEREFCRLQPYAGVGLGVFFAHLKNGTHMSDDAVPGLNALAGVRYFINERIALFGEYKYNWAAFEFENGPAGVKGDYRVNHVVGGLSFHF